jgi:putative lipoic acid-binding regulatory protein
MTDPGRSAIEFPCAFPLKIMGHAAPDFVEHAQMLVARHIEVIDPARIRTNASRSGKYVSVTIEITARDQAQLDAIYRTLADDERVVMAL